MSYLTRPENKPPRTVKVSATKIKDLLSERGYENNWANVGSASEDNIQLRLFACAQRPSTDWSNAYVSYGYLRSHNSINYTFMHIGANFHHLGRDTAVGTGS
jgi:hypothetical protein